MIIKALFENPGITQIDLSKKISKNNASVTRLIDLLVKAKYLDCKTNPQDRRTSVLKVTVSGEEIIYKVQDLVRQNQRNAQVRISIEDLENLNSTLQRIIVNCQS